MIADRIWGTIPLLASVVVAVVLAGASGAQAAAPVKLTLASQFGQEVNVTEAGKGNFELENVCTVASKDECQPGKASAAPGGFELTESVAAGPLGDVYVLDAGNKRVEEFSASGQFVLMFGWDVNKTKVKKGTATHQEMTLCTEAEIKAKGECQAGVEGGAPGQFSAPYSIAVDSAGDVYVAEVVFVEGAFGERVQKLTAEGQFVFEIGKDVNETKATNLCTQEEETKDKVKCTAPSAYVMELGSFNFEGRFGNVLAVGHEGNLYVGDEGRVQEFNDETGASSGEVPLEPGVRVDALTVDEVGDVYLTDHTSGSSGNEVREFNAKGESTNSFVVSPEDPRAEVRIRGLAVDADGLAVATEQQTTSTNIVQFGALYEANSANLLNAFKIPAERLVKGLAFSGSGELYVATQQSNEILAYTPKVVAALSTTAPGQCALGTAREADVAFNCTLNGEVNPEGIAETEAWFEWGRGSEAGCGLGSLTPREMLVGVNSLPISAPIEGLRPNEDYCYRLAAEDLDAKAPEPLATGLSSFKTQFVAPRVVGEPQAQFVKASSVVMFGELNPENAQTTYSFEYAPGAKALAQCGSILEDCAATPCSTATRTLPGKSGVYGLIGATSEAVGLRPGTTYSYRLFAENENASQTAKCATLSSEGSLTTATVPSPSATTGGCNSIGATSAVISATVTPDGAPVTYSFELGVYEGAATQYGVVSSGNVEANAVPTPVSLSLTGLQPGTTYAYRIAISSGYIDNNMHTLEGGYEKFTTAGLPAVLQPPLELAQLPTPAIAFPKAPIKPKTKAKKKTKRGKAKKGKKGHRSDTRRAR
jgi:hypothetical protein